MHCGYGLTTKVEFLLVSHQPQKFIEVLLQPTSFGFAGQVSESALILLNHTTRLSSFAMTSKELPLLHDVAGKYCVLHNSGILLPWQQFRLHTSKCPKGIKRSDQFSPRIKTPRWPEDQVILPTDSNQRYRQLAWKCSWLTWSIEHSVTLNLM